MRKTRTGRLSRGTTRGQQKSGARPSPESQKQWLNNGDTGDALALVEEQEKLLKNEEPIEPQIRSDGSFEPSWYYCCGNCDGPIDKPDKYCRHCGKKVEWYLTDHLFESYCDQKNDT